MATSSTPDTDIVICSPLRTPVGRIGGALSSVPVTRLATDLLKELTTQHAANQALMRQELAFLDHLLNVIEPVASLGYEQGGGRNAMPAAPRPGHSLDLHA